MFIKIGGSPLFGKRACFAIYQGSIWLLHAAHGSIPE
jgi:hypothetical protein